MSAGNYLWFIAGITIQEITPLIILAFICEHCSFMPKTHVMSINMYNVIHAISIVICWTVQGHKQWKRQTCNAISSYWLHSSLLLAIHNKTSVYSEYTNTRMQITVRNKAKTCDTTVRLMTCISGSSSEKCLFCNEKACLKGRHKDPDRRDWQENKTHQTPVPKRLPLITTPV